MSDLFSSAIRERLFHVGRLDFLSTGLILYTNDGEFAKLVSHPGVRDREGVPGGDGTGHR